MTAANDGAERLPDDALFDRAGELGRVLFSQDHHLLAHATARQRKGIKFHGLVYGHQLRVTIGGCIDDLELIAKVYDPMDVTDRVIHLPL